MINRIPFLTKPLTEDMKEVVDALLCQLFDDDNLDDSEPRVEHRPAVDHVDRKVLPDRDVAVVGRLLDQRSDFLDKLGHIPHLLRPIRTLYLKT